MGKTWGLGGRACRVGSEPAPGTVALGSGHQKAQHKPSVPSGRGSGSREAEVGGDSCHQGPLFFSSDSVQKQEWSMCPCFATPVEY